MKISTGVFLPISTTAVARTFKCIQFCPFYELILRLRAPVCSSSHMHTKMHLLNDGRRCARCDVAMKFSSCIRYSNRFIHTHTHTHTAAVTHEGLALWLVCVANFRMCDACCIFFISLPLPTFFVTVAVSCFVLSCRCIVCVYLLLFLFNNPEAMKRVVTK